MPFRPEPNKAVERDRELKAYEAHRRRVENAQPTVDTRPPRTYMHQHLNMKRLQLEEERLAQIERDNRKLLQRMSDIMRSGGRIDNWNSYEHRSNASQNRRRNETLRIARENQYIHDRIVSRKPEYDHKQWDADWKVTQKRLEQHSSYNKDGTEKYPRRPQRTDKKEGSAASSVRSGDRSHDDRDVSSDDEVSAYDGRVSAREGRVSAREVSARDHHGSHASQVSRAGSKSVVRSDDEKDLPGRASVASRKESVTPSKQREKESDAESDVDGSP